MEDQTQHETEYEEVSLGRYAAIAVVVALVLAAGAFFAGKAAAGSSGPATLADAVTDARNGKLPCGGDPQATPPAADGAPQRANPDFLVQTICNPDRQGTFRRGTTGGGGFAFGGPTGRITAITGTTLTVQGRQGSQKVTLGGSTTVRKLATGAKGDLKTGQNVIVSGAPGGARSVTILPSGQGQ